MVHGLSSGMGNKRACFGAASCAKLFLGQVQPRQMPALTRTSIDVDQLSTLHAFDVRDLLADIVTDDRNMTVVDRIDPIVTTQREPIVIRVAVGLPIQRAMKQTRLLLHRFREDRRLFIEHARNRTRMDEYVVTCSMPQTRLPDDIQQAVDQEVAILGSHDLFDGLRQAVARLDRGLFALPSTQLLEITIQLGAVVPRRQNRVPAANQLDRTAQNMRAIIGQTSGVGVALIGQITDEPHLHSLSQSFVDRIVSRQRTVDITNPPHAGRVIEKARRESIHQLLLLQDFEKVKEVIGHPSKYSMDDDLFRFDFEEDNPEKIAPASEKVEVKIINEDCIVTLRRFKEEGMMFDAVICDPPYGIGLHGKTWDTGELAFAKEFWTLVYDVVKPGGFLAAFASCRLYHHMAMAAEQAGFEAYPFLLWEFAGGMPKPMNISTLFDRDNIPDRQPIGERKGTGYTTGNVKHGAQQRTKTNFAVYAKNVSQEAKDWDGFYYGVNTFSPVVEPIFLGQKPRDEKRMIDNIRKHKVGGINIGAIKERIAGAWPTTKFFRPKARFEKDVDLSGIDHPSIKPVSIMEDLIVLLCPPGGHLLDPFAGTGTTGVAAVRQGRGVTLIERDAEWIPVIERRLGGGESLVE